MALIIHRRTILKPLVLAALGAVLPAVAFAQADYPNRAIKMVVPVPPGPMLDVLPRIIGEKLQARWGQPIVVENRPGAASNVGAEAVFKSAPDGYTLLVTPPGPLAISQHVYARLGFDPAAFVPVSTLIRFPFIAIVNPKLPIANLQELVAYAKANPNKLTFATPGVSSTPHLTMEKLMAAAGIRFVHVPFPGLAPALNGLIGGHIDAMFDTPGNILEHAREGKVRAVAVTGAQRFAELPQVPALAELFPGVIHQDWFAVVAPPRTPPEIAAKLSQAIAETMKLPDVAKRLADFHITAVAGSPSETAALMKSEAEKFRVLIQAAGIKVE